MTYKQSLLSYRIAPNGNKTFQIDPTTFISIGLQNVMDHCRMDQKAIQYNGNIVLAS